mmetsp:Transcript_61271/g.198189  ORF Transcript_61271/g.198189 Transcript_61271/m.198189 type:complete len:227 (+) Transcript_61271:1374-2054(+)
MRTTGQVGQTTLKLRPSGAKARAPASQRRPNSAQRGATTAWFLASAACQADACWTTCAHCPCRTTRSKCSPLAAAPSLASSSGPRRRRLPTKGTASTPRTPRPSRTVESKDKSSSSVAGRHHQRRSLTPNGKGANEGPIDESTVGARKRCDRRWPSSSVTMTSHISPSVAPAACEAGASCTCTDINRCLSSGVMSPSSFPPTPLLGARGWRKDSFATQLAKMDRAP